MIRELFSQGWSGKISWKQKVLICSINITRSVLHKLTDYYVQIFCKNCTFAIFIIFKLSYSFRVFTTKYTETLWFHVFFQNIQLSFSWKFLYLHNHIWCHWYFLLSYSYGLWGVIILDILMIYVLCNNDCTCYNEQILSACKFQWSWMCFLFLHSHTLFNFCARPALNSLNSGRESHLCELSQARLCKPRI
jgi:hypothetical protein